MSKCGSTSRLLTNIWLLGRVVTDNYVVYSSASACAIIAARTESSVCVPHVP